MDNKLKIINYLGKKIGKKFTMHELSKILNIPYASFYRTIMKMKDVLTIENIGKSKTLQLNTKNSILKSYLTISSDEEKKEHLKKHQIIRIITEELNIKDIVVLFGSYSKGKEDSKSDIDILIINKGGKKTLSFAKYETLYKKRINPIFITEKEFRDMLKDEEENIGKQALKNHMIMNNPENFWRNVLDAI